MRYIRNGIVTIGAGRFWRIDDTSAMRAPDYDPLRFLREPFALISARVAVEDIDKLLERLNAGEPDA